MVYSLEAPVPRAEKQPLGGSGFESVLWDFFLYTPKSFCCLLRAGWGGGHVMAATSAWEVPQSSPEGARGQCWLDPHGHGVKLLPK